MTKQLSTGGWVQNLDDGRVEAVFKGPKDAVKRLIEWCHEGNSRCACRTGGGGVQGAREPQWIRDPTVAVGADLWSAQSITDRQTSP